MLHRNLGMTTCMARVSGQKRDSRVSISDDADETLDAPSSYKGYTISHNLATPLATFSNTTSLFHIQSLCHD
jgi:hypothetical protein